MSAAAQAQPVQKALPKVLRIGIVQDGKVTERLIRSGDAVSVGDSTKATFAFSGHGLGQIHTLFAPAGGSYQLVVSPAVEGKISWKDGIRDLSDLRARGEMQKKGEHWALQLNENVRGKVVLGTTTLLFQFVNAPPEPVRAVSPADFRPRFFNDDDPLFLGLTAVFNGIALLFYVAVMLQPHVEEDPMKLLKSTLDLYPDKEPEEVVIQVQPEKGNTEDTKPAETKKADTKPAATSKATSAPSAESVTKQSLALQMFGTAGEGSDQMALDILGDQQAMSGQLDAALGNVSGAEVATAGNVGLMGGKGGGQGDVAVGITRSDGSAAGTGDAAVIKVVRAKAVEEAGERTDDEGDGSGVVKVVKGSKARIETCVQQALKKDPTTNGRVAVGWGVNKGKVIDAHITSNSTKNEELGACVLRTVRSLRFDEGYSGTIDEYAWVVSGVE